MDFDKPKVYGDTSITDGLGLESEKASCFLTLSSGTSSAQNENLRTLFITNIPLISGKYGLINRFWPLEKDFFMRKSEKKGHNFLGPKGQIFKFTFSECLQQIQQLS